MLLKGLKQMRKIEREIEASTIKEIINYRNRLGVKPFEQVVDFRVQYFFGGRDSTLFLLLNGGNLHIYRYFGDENKYEFDAISGIEMRTILEMYENVFEKAN